MTAHTCERHCRGHGPDFVGRIRIEPPLNAAEAVRFHELATPV
jgi:hypothetical protein